MPLQDQQIRGVRLLVDREATRAAYAQITDPGCDCCYCRNFQATADQLIQPEVTSILRDLGIDVHKPAEIIHFQRVRPNAHFYEAMYPLSGEIPEQEGLEVSQVGSELTKKIPFDGGQIGFSTMPFPGHSVFDRARTVLLSLYFDCVPWVIDHPEPE